MKNKVLTIFFGFLFIAVVIYSADLYQRHMLKQRVRRAGEFLSHPLSKASYTPPSHDLYLTDEQVDKLVDDYWNRQGGSSSLKNVGIRFRTVCSVKLKEALIRKYGKENTVVVDPPLKDRCRPKSNDLNTYAFTLDLIGLDDHSILIKIEDDSANFSGYLYAWNGSTWDAAHKFSGAGLLMPPKCPDQRGLSNP